MSSFTKEEIIAEIVSRTGIDAQDTRAMLNTLDELIAERLNAGERVFLDNIGTFQKVVKPPTKKYVPKTKETKDVPERIRVKFNTSKTLLERLEK